MEIAKLEQPIDTFAVAPGAGVALLGAADNTIWLVHMDSQVSAPIKLRASGSKATQMLTMADGASICIAYANGDVEIVQTATGARTALMHASGAVTDEASTPDGDTLAIAANDGTVQIGVRLQHRDEQALAWRTLNTQARSIMLTADGLLLAACTVGVIRLYSVVGRTWSCIPTGTVSAAVTPDGKIGLVVDNEGRIIQIDLTSLRDSTTPSLRQPLIKETDK